MTSTNPQETVISRSEPSSSSTVLGKNIIIKGVIHSEEDLTIDGDEGTIDAGGTGLPSALTQQCALIR